MSTNVEILDLQQYEKLERLSSSSFYDVFKVKQIDTEKIYMAKILLNVADDTNNPFRREINKAIQYDIPSFIKYIGYCPTNFENKKRPVVVVEFCQNGQLDKIIGQLSDGKPVPGWNDTKKLICLFGIAAGISLLHSKNIAFKDLNPSNVFLDESFYPKLHGFSHSSSIDEDIPEQDINNDNILPSYMAPEVINSEPYTLKSDVYSFGILAYEIISGHFAFAKATNLMKILTGARPQFDESVPESFQKLISQCWADEIDERPDISDIVDQLKANPNFISENVDKDEFNNYIALFDKTDSTISDSEKYFNDGINSLRTDKKKAFQCFKKSADEGNTEAMNCCGVMLLNGDDIPYDETEAGHYLKIAADSGNIEAMNNYGYFLLQSKSADGEDKAPVYFKMAADKGNVEAMLNYAHLLYCGDKNHDIPPNKQEALNYFKMAADKNNTDGLYYYALMLKKGEGVDQPNLKEAFKLLKKASDDKKNPKLEAMLECALLLLDDDADIGVDHNVTESLNYLKKSIQKEDIDAMYNYAYILYNGINGIESDKKEALKYYKKSAMKGHPKAMNEFALLLQNEEIKGEDNINEIVSKYYKLAADFGCVDAMYNYGWLLFNGIGMDSNFEKALTYFKKAADFGHIDAMYKYATMIKYGEGATRNKKEAAEYYKKAADQGSVDAMNSYALMLFKDDDITQNDEEALKYFKMAADLGHANAMNNYGEMLLDGRGIDQNNELALQYFKMAADLDDQDGMANYRNSS